MADDTSPEQLMCVALVRSGAVDSCAATLVLESSDREELAATDDHLRGVSELEFTLWEGPGPDAIETGALMVVDDLWAETIRWPQLAERVKAYDVRGVVVLPIRIDGVMGLFTGSWREVHRCSADEVVALAAYARALGVVATQRLKEPPFIDEWRSPIAPAVGMVMSRSGLSADDALELLRSHAFTHDTTVSALCRRLVTGDLALSDVV